MKTSLAEMIAKTTASLNLQLESSAVNAIIMQESEIFVEMNDALFMEWFIKKEERVQLYNQMMTDAMSEESIWYDSDSSR